MLYPYFYCLGETAEMKKINSLLWVFLLLLAAACTSIPQTGVLPPSGSEAPPAAPPTQETQVEAAPSAEPQTGEQPIATPIVQPQGGESVQPLPNMEDEYFFQDLATAIVGRDYSAMRLAMQDSPDGLFRMAYWRSEGTEVAPDQAIELMRQSFFVQGSDPVTDLSIDTSTLLPGADPLLIFGPVNAIRAFHVTALGPNAADEAIAVVARNPHTGRLYWHGVLVAQGGFEEQPKPGSDLDAFGAQLALAFEGRDFTALRRLMNDRFSIATDNTLFEVNSEEALQQLVDRALAPGSTPVVVFGTDVVALLQGTDPLDLWGPVANPVKAIHVMGLGQNADQEGLVVIGRRTTGEFYWHGILLPDDGYFHTGSPGEASDRMPTSVEYVMAKEDVNVRTGPGTHFAVEGRIWAGQIAKVSGISRDGGWWQIVCSQDASGFCWVSADPSLTEPTSPPG
jgi:hypothetical protein